MTLAALRFVDEARSLGRHLARYRGVAIERLRDDLTTRHDVLFSIVMMSETLGDISPSVLGLEPDIPFRAVRGMRNRIIHRRHEMRWDIVREVVDRDVPHLLAGLDRLAHRLQSTDA